MTIFTEAFFTLVGGDFVSFTFLSAGHNSLYLLFGYLNVDHSVLKFT